MSDNDVSRVVSTFRGLGGLYVNAVLDASGFTRFVPEEDEDEGEVGKIYFGPDIYPGTSVIDPNSALSMPAAVAHELSHLARWRDKTEYPLGFYRHLDEAMTSLDAALRYWNNLGVDDVQTLVRDAMQRIQLQFAELGDADAARRKAEADPTEVGG
jgi:hypothetical protein